MCLEDKGSWTCYGLEVLYNKNKGKSDSFIEKLKIVFGLRQGRLLVEQSWKKLLVVLSWKNFSGS